MTKAQIEAHVLTLGNVGIALSQIEVKGEQNLNLLLAAIQTVRQVRDALRKESQNDHHNEQGEDVYHQLGVGAVRAEAPDDGAE